MLRLRVVLGVAAVPRPPCLTLPARRCSSCSFNLFDFLAIVPFYLNVLFKFDAIPLRLVRMLRIFKLSSRIEGTQVVMEALKASLRSLLIPLYMLVVITLIFGAALYLAESGTPVIAADGEEVFVHSDGSPSEVTGILRAGWVIIVTMTTVGYGDITPVTFLGRVVCVTAMLFGTLYVDARGVAAGPVYSMACRVTDSVPWSRGAWTRHRYMAMPIAIVGNNFWKAYETLMKRKAEQDPANKCAPPPSSLHALPNPATSTGLRPWRQVHAVLTPQPGSFAACLVSQSEAGGGAAAPNAPDHLRAGGGLGAQACSGSGHDGPPHPQAAQGVQGPGSWCVAACV